MLLFRPERNVVNYWFTGISFSTSPCSFLLLRTTSGQRYRSTWDLVFRLSLSLSQWLSPPLPRLRLSSGSMRDLRRVCVRKPEDFVLSEFCCNFNLFFFFLQTRPLAVFAWRAASSLTCLGPMVAPGLIFTGSTSEAVTGKLFLSLMINDKRQFDLNMKRWHRCMELLH